MKLIFLCVALIIATLSTALAQNPPRVDDHFHRKKVLYRVTLDEKINFPMVNVESNLYLPNEGKYKNKKGIVNAILSGFSRDDYKGYLPDTLTKEIAYLDFLKLFYKACEKNYLDPPGASADTEVEEEEEELEDDEEEGRNDDMATPGELIVEGPVSRYGERSTGAVLDFVEDRIFDKNKSDLYHDIQWVRINFVDFDEKCTDRTLVAFRYKDLMDVLNNTQWKNRFNDAEYRTLQEIFELRLFNCYVMEISAERVQDMYESEVRRGQMVEFEHHLWNY